MPWTSCPHHLASIAHLPWVHFLLAKRSPFSRASRVPAPRSPPQDLLACGTFQPGLLKEQLGALWSLHPNQQHPSFAHLSSRPWGWSHLSSQVEQTELTPHEYQLGRLHQEVLILYYLQVFDLSWMRSDTARLVLLVGAKQGRKSLWMGMMQQLPAEKKLLVQLRGSQCCRLPKLFPYQWLL